MTRVIRALIVVAIVVAALALILLGVWTWFTRQAFPQTAGTIKVSGLSQAVDVVRDEYGVAHIYGHTPEDLFFAQGYTHAQERFWQMEFQRRVGAGRLSEIFGENTLATDRFIRQFGFYDLAQQAYEMLDEQSQSILDAYAAGVNAYISERSPSKMGLEFALLGLQGVDVEVEEWQPADSLVWAEMLIFNQASVPPSELTLVDVLYSGGEDALADLLPPYREDRPVIIPSEELAHLSEADLSPLAALDPPAVAYVQAAGQAVREETIVPALLADLGLFQQSASNSYAISGDLTTTGAPLLANDPHMGIDIPSLWYEIGLHCVEKSEACIYNLRGFSLPGVPGILIGHNDRIAWGLTNAAFDVEDVFVERINPENPDQYEVNGEWADMDIRREEIDVRGRSEPEVLFVRSTRNGLVLTDAILDQSYFTYEDIQLTPYALTLAWTALEPVRSFQAVHQLNQAQNWDDFVEAARFFDAGKQNWLYADVEGNIGYIMPGKVPIRASGDGTLPVPGWNDDYRWTGFIPFDDLPRVFNPDQGYIATANNPQVRAEDYPYFLGRFQERGQRAERIVELINADADGISVDDMMAIQTDNQSLVALEIIPYLADLTLSDQAQANARDRLLAWDGQVLADSPEAALYNIFWFHLVAETFYDQVDRSLVEGGTYTADTLYLLLQDANDRWWDDVRTANITEDRDEILARALRLAWEEGVDLFGDQLDSWRWGDVHTKEYRNQTLGRSGVTLIERIFNRGPVAVSGSEEVIVKTDWSLDDPYRVTGVIPALRQVVDLGDLTNTRMIQAVGQSGHPMHQHYDDFIDPWRHFEYHPSNWDRADAESGQYDLLTLEP